MITAMIIISTCVYLFVRRRRKKRKAIIAAAQKKSGKITHKPKKSKKSQKSAKMKSKKSKKSVDKKFKGKEETDKSTKSKAEAVSCKTDEENKSKRETTKTETSPEPTHMASAVRSTVENESAGMKTAHEHGSHHSLKSALQHKSQRSLELKTAHLHQAANQLKTSRQKEHDYGTMLMSARGKIEPAGQELKALGFDMQRRALKKQNKDLEDIIKIQYGKFEDHTEPSRSVDTTKTKTSASTIGSGPKKVMSPRGRRN